MTVRRWPRRDVVRLPAWDAAWATDDGIAGLDARGDLWVEAADAVVWVAGPFTQVCVDAGPVRAWGEDAIWDGAQRVVGGPAGDGQVARSGNAWGPPTGALPEGAQRARAAWPAGDGAAFWWWDDGVVYAWTRQGVTAVCTAAEAPAIAVGPGGRALLDGERLMWADGRVVALEVPVDASRWVRWSPEALWGSDGEAACRFDARGRLCARAPGVPIGRDRVLPLPEGDRAIALSGHWLAGPGAAVWDLERGVPTDAVLPDGPVAPLGDGFAAADWSTGIGACFDMTGRERHAFAVPLRGAHLTDWTATGDGVALRASDGRCWTLDAAGRLTPAPRRAAPPPAPEPVGTPPVDGHAHGWRWRADGLLLRNA